MVLDAFSGRGGIASRWSPEARRAGLKSRVAISSANRSSVSSTATASRCRSTATSVAVLFGSPSRASAEALLPSPLRASTCSRFAGMSSTPTRLAPSTAICSARRNALTISGPELRRGDWRSRSSAETRRPSGTCSKSPSRCGSPEIYLPGRRGQHLIQPGLGRLTRGGHLPREHRHAGQQDPIAAQPAHRVIEQCHRPLSVRPRPPAKEPRKRLHAARIVERPVAVPVADLPRMLAMLHQMIPPHLRIHLIMDNGSSHTSRATKAWLAAHARFTVTYTPSTHPG